ncbi:Uu.00g096890.m01.CDS01 [Anthostomella pinea]|uniref:Uu.00g096890.m01.CDS01 n=1 Tax=Anthostomella pinea TaxID=933095 RepID=A0AAI8VCA1_9PEZI|nr:Uu.00g096890.m01.CDS01 [Anthostomella pinea]
MQQPFSTLEIRGVEFHGPYDRDISQKEGTHQHDSLYPQVVPAAQLPRSVNDPEAYATLERPHSPQPPVIERKPVSTICGIQRRIFYITVVIVLLVIVGATAGGVEGALLVNHHNQETSPDPGGDSSTGVPSNNTVSKPGIANINVLSSSRLKSTNWTDAEGFAHRAVFFQDPYNSIIARRWDVQNTTWSTTNLTQIIKGPTTSLNPLPNTPLASAACKYNNTTIEVQLWFLTPNYSIRNVRLLSPTAHPEAWEFDNLNGATLRTMPGSDLDAAWQRCRLGDCIGNWLVAYQAPDGNINMANASHWVNAPNAVGRGGVADNSSLAITAQLDGVWADRVALVSESLTSATGGSMQKTGFNGAWDPDDGYLISDLPLPSPMLQFAATVMRNFTETLSLALLPNGTVTGDWWAQQWHSIPIVKFSGGPSALNFSAVSTSEDAMFYGMTNDEILEYSLDQLDPSSFVYVGRVFP